MGAGSAAVDPALYAIWAEVLEVDALDVEDDFFALGGNSLLATQITARVADVLGVEVPLDALFEAPTLGGYAELVRAAAPTDGGRAPARAGSDGERERGRGLRGLLRGRRDGARSERPPRGGRTNGGATPEGTLSMLQASAWSVERYRPGAGPVVGQVFTLQGPLDAEALARAFTALVERHELLRTSFPFESHRPRARVHPPQPVVLDRIGDGKRMRDEEVRRLVDAAWSESFDYTTVPPLHLRLIQTGKNAHVLIFLLHEIVCDGQAYDLLVRELGQLYDAEVAGDPSPLEPAAQYGDVVRAYGPQLAGHDTETGQEHWRDALAGAPLTLPLPHERLERRTVAEQGSYTRRSVQLPAQLVTQLRALAQEETATSFMLHLAALYALLHRWSGETDLLVRSAAANRARVEWERVVGFFSMVLPLRVDVSDDPSFRTLLRRTRDSALGGFRHASSAPEDNAVRAIGGMRGLGGATALFRLWDPTTEQPLELTGVQAKPYRDDGEAGQLVLVVTERADGRTVAQLSSVTQELDARALGELLHHYERLLEQVAEDPDRRIGSEVALLTPAEQERFSGRAPGGARGGEAGGLHGLVAAAAARTPDAIAFDAGGGAAAVTYAELERRAAGVAGLLRARGVEPGALVGLELAPGGELLAALLGVLMAGAVAVPLREPGLEEDPLAGLPPLATVLDADAVRAAMARGRNTNVVEPERVALVLRTTGVSDGPRAVELTHDVLCRAALRQRDGQRLTARDRVAHVPGRGAWSWALAPWATLAAGATIVGPERAPQARSASSPSGWLEANAVTVAAMDPWLASAALARPAALPATLRLLGVQGAGPLATPAEAGGRGRLEVQRQYGLTELGGAAIYDVARSSAHATSGGRSTNAGAPLSGEPAGVRARVLDRYGNVAPAGVSGELELNDGGGAVRSGDVARRRADGALELIGRGEDELRWRGVRLQPILQDLEAALVTHPGVQDAAACWEPAGEALIACVVPRRAEAPARAQLDEWIQRAVPDWILPAHYVTVDAIPLRADGLPDRRALAASPAVAQALAAADDAEPRTPTERKLAGIWKQVLGVRPASAHDNLFAAGGSLIHGVELVARAREAGIQIEASDVMYRPTIAELAAIADARR